MVSLLVHHLLLLAGIINHAYYVSVCEIYHNQKTEQLEITIKIFADDLELALRNDGNDSISVVEENPGPGLQDALQNYLDKKFIIIIDDAKQPIKVIGFQFKDDTLLCFAESSRVKSINRFKIINIIISEIYPEQINLTHFQYHGQMKSFKTGIDEPDGGVDVRLW